MLDTALTSQPHAVESTGAFLPIADGRVLKVQRVYLVDFPEDTFELLNGDGDQLAPAVDILRGAADWNTQ